MTSRQKKLYDLLTGHEYLTSGQLAGMLHVSDRTIRNDIREINGELGEVTIESRMGQGYYLKNKTKDKKELHQGELTAEADMIREIVRRVLFEEKTEYLELAEELYISDSTLSKLILQINRFMEPRYRGEGIRKKSGKLVLLLSESEKREYYASYVLSSNISHYFDIESYQPYFDIVEMNTWSKCMIGYCKSRRIKFQDTTLVRLIISTGVVGERVAQGYLLEGDTGETVEEDRLELLRDLEGIIGRTFPLSEISYFNRLFRDDFYLKKEECKTEEILDKILSEIKREYAFDFSEDLEFIKEMQAQLNGIFQRKKYAQHLVNPVLFRIKSQYPLEYDISIYIADRFKKITGIEIGEDEIGMITIHVMKAMESRLIHMEKKVALINPYGKQVTELIRKRLEEMGECSVKVEYQYSYFDYPIEMPKDVMAVLTTVKLPVPVEGIPVIVCRNFLDFMEKEKLLRVVRESQISIMRTYFKTLFKPSLFFTNMDFHSREEAIFFMYQRLMEQGYVEEDFFQSVMQREMIAPTAFEPGFAFAHAMENNARKTAVCICILKNKLPWGEYSVKIVFLFALASSWNHTMVPVYNVMIDHLFRAKTIHKLAKIRDCGEFMNQLI